MKDPAKEVARVVRRVFRVMRLQYAGGKEKFGDWIGRLAKELVEPLAAAVLGGLRRGLPRGADRALHHQLGQDGAAAAKIRAMESARSILQTTNDWIEEGRDERQVFGVDRSVMIGLTEAKWAEGMGITLGAKAGKGRVRWVNDPKPCASCKKLAGKIVKAGTVFTVHDGVAVYHPPLHPSCRCFVEVVQSIR